MIGVGVLKAQLIPVAQSPGNIWGIAEGLITMVLRALRPVEKESRAPLPVPFIGDVRVQTERADVAFEFIAAQPGPGKTAVGVKKIAAIAVEDFRAPVQPLKLIVPQRHVTHLQVEARDPAFLFGQWDAIRSHEGIQAAAILSLWVNQTGKACFQLHIGGQIEIGREPPKIIESAQSAKLTGIIEGAITSESNPETCGQAHIMREGGQP